MSGTERGEHAATIHEAVAIVAMGPDAHISPLTAWRLADAVVALAAALAEHEGCVPRAEYDAKHSTIVDLLEEHYEAEAAALRTEREALADRVDSLRDQVGRLTRERDEWEANEQEQHRELARLRTEREALREALRFEHYMTGGPHDLCDTCALLARTDTGGQE